jgi:UDP:flavonoid glycosyltransferase YjiC (YdhE family)
MFSQTRVYRLPLYTNKEQTDCDQGSASPLLQVFFFNMKILIPTTAAPGHFNPILELAKLLMKHGHEVRVQTGNTLRHQVDAAGIPFLSLLPEADVPVTEFFARHLGERPTTLNYFLPKLTAQLAGLKAVLRYFPADLILTECMFFGRYHYF